MRRTQLILAVLLTLALGAAGCSDDGGSDDDFSDILPGGDDELSDGSGGSGGDGNDGGSSNGSTSGTGDLLTVWPLPDGDYSVLLPYDLIDDEFQFSEFASFLTTSVTMDEVLEFYRQYFPTIGLGFNEIPLGESIAMNLTHPDDPLWSGVMQTGVDPEGNVTISQNYSDPKESTETTTTRPPAEASSDGSGIAGE